MAGEAKSLRSCSSFRLRCEGAVELAEDVFRLMLGDARRGPYGNLASIPAPFRATELTPRM